MDDDLSLENLFAGEDLPDELYRLVHDGLVGELELRLKEIDNPKEHLHALRWYGSEQLSLLMVAAYHGRDSIVALLLTLDCSDTHVELAGEFFIAEQEERFNGATALYCACFRGHFRAAKILVEVGHAVVKSHTPNHRSMTLLTHAIVYNRLDIVRFLLDGGYTDANEGASDESLRWPPLLHAANQNFPAIIEYLLDKGADVNHKHENRFSSDTTALSLTIEQNHFESFHVLCQRGAHHALKDDPDRSFLKSALKIKSYPMVQFFLEENLIDVDDLEFAAAVNMAKGNARDETEHIVELLRLALQYRRRFGLPKMPFEPLSIYNYQRECETMEELDALVNDHERLLIESILILERLFPSRKETSLHSLVETFGTQLVQQHKYEQCFDLWLHLAEFDLQYRGDYGMHLFVWYFCKLLTAEYRISASRFLQAAYLIFKPDEMSYGEKDVNNALFLVVLATKILQQPLITSDEQLSIYQWVQQLCQLKALVTDGRTVLHLCVNRRTSSNLTYRGSDTTPHISFPHPLGLYLLLSYGRQWLDVNSMDLRRNTPLHLHCQNQPDPKIIQILLHFGAHLDCPNKEGKIASDYVREKPTILPLLEPKAMPSPLKCLSARSICSLISKDETLLENFSLPLREFLHLHRVN